MCALQCLMHCKHTCLCIAGDLGNLAFIMRLDLPEHVHLKCTCLDSYMALQTHMWIVYYIKGFCPPHFTIYIAKQALVKKGQVKNETRMRG